MLGRGVGRGERASLGEQRSEVVAAARSYRVSIAARWAGGCHGAYRSAENLRKVGVRIAATDGSARGAEDQLTCPAEGGVRLQRKLSIPQCDPGSRGEASAKLFLKKPVFGPPLVGTGWSGSPKTASR